MDVTKFFSLGERILFLPILIIIILIGLGLVLFIAVSIATFLIHLPVSLFNRSFRENKEQTHTLNDKAGSGNKFTKKDILMTFKSGSWIVWVAASPLVIAVFALLFYLLGFIFP